MVKTREYILGRIKEILRTVAPETKAILYGSQARGDAREDSDWDILILLNKEKLDNSDHDNYSYPLFELGWNINAQIHPMLYTTKDWLKRKFSILYKNVEQEGIELC